MNMEPCPFCGDKEPRLIRNLATKNRYVQCQSESCRADGPIGKTDKEGIDKWNGRHPHPPAVVRNCPHCGSDSQFILRVIDGRPNAECGQCHTTYFMTKEKMPILMPTARNDVSYACECESHRACRVSMCGCVCHRKPEPIAEPECMNICPCGGQYMDGDYCRKCL